MLWQQSLQGWLHAEQYTNKDALLPRLAQYMFAWFWTLSEKALPDLSWLPTESFSLVCSMLSDAHGTTYVIQGLSSPHPSTLGNEYDSVVF